MEITEEPSVSPDNITTFQKLMPVVARGIIKLPSDVFNTVKNIDDEKKIKRVLKKYVENYDYPFLIENNNKYLLVEIKNV